MADLALFSELSVQRSLGLPKELLRSADVRGEALSADDWVDMSRGKPRQAAAEELLLPAAWSIHNQLGDEDYDMQNQEHSVNFTFALEVKGAKLNRSDAYPVTLSYPALVMPEAPCRIEYVGNPQPHYVSSAAEAEQSLSSHIQGINANMSVGVARESLHLHMRRNEPDMSSVFTRMWLVLLGVTAGDAIEVKVDRPALRYKLHGVDERHMCDEAKLLPGLRINARGLDSVTLALLVLGCSSLNDTYGLNGRASRYHFPSAQLTLYGTHDIRVSTVALRSPSSIASAITGLAARFNLKEQCGHALRTALVLYGMHSCGRRVALKCAEPHLHDDTHISPTSGNSPYERTHDLGDKRLLGLALFLGRTWRQCFGHILRAGMSKVAATDVQAARDYILPNQQLLITQGGKLHDKLMGAYPTLIDSVRYGHAHYASLWNERGVVHCIAAGLVVDDSVLQEVVDVIPVPTVPQLGPIDDPAMTRDVKEKIGTLTLVDEMLSNCGERLRGSKVARVEAIDSNLQISNATMQLSGCEVQFTLLGIGSGITITRGVQGYAMEPILGTVRTEPAAPMTSKSPMEDTRDRAPARPETSDIDDLINGGLYEPKGSTVARAIPTMIPDSGMYDTSGAIRMPEDQAQAVYAAVGRGATVLPTSGEGLMCAANALYMTMGAMGMNTSQEEITVALRHGLTDEEREMSRLAGMDAGANNFTADQVVRALELLGGHRLGIVRETQPNHANLLVLGGGTGRVVPLHHAHNHWSATGQGGNKPITIDRSAPKDAT